MRNFSTNAAAKLDEVLNDHAIYDTALVTAIQMIAVVGIAQSLDRIADSLESIELSATDINLTLQRIERGQS